MILRRALAGGLFGLLIAASAPVASASAAEGDYPPDGDNALTVSATVVGVGTTITVTGDGYPPGPVVITSTVVQGFARTDVGTEDLGGFRSTGSTPTVQRLAAVQRFAAVAACSTGVTCGATANSAGTFSVPFTLTRVGTTVITASGGGVVKSQTVQVGTSGSNGGSGGSDSSGSGSGSGSGAGDLPNTGSSIGLPVTLGVILVLLGAALTTVVRRRKRGGVAA